MCCTRIFADVILANLFGSDRFVSFDPISMEDIKNFCSYLDNFLPGFIFFENSEEDMKEVARKYPQFYQFANGRIYPMEYMPIRTNFNTAYRGEIANIIEEAADRFMESQTRLVSCHTA